MRLENLRKQLQSTGSFSSAIRLGFFGFKLPLHRCLYKQNKKQIENNTNISFFFVNNRFIRCLK